MPDPLTTETENELTIIGTVFEECLEECIEENKKTGVKNENVGLTKSNLKGLKELQKIEPSLKSNVLNIFDLKNSVNSKNSYGGTSFDNIKKMIIKYKKIL